GPLAQGVEFLRGDGPLRGREPPQGEEGDGRQGEREGKSAARGDEADLQVRGTRLHGPPPRWSDAEATGPAARPGTAARGSARAEGERGAHPDRTQRGGRRQIESEGSDFLPRPRFGGRGPPATLPNWAGGEGVVCARAMQSILQSRSPSPPTP